MDLTRDDLSVPYQSFDETTLSSPLAEGSVVATSRDNSGTGSEFNVGKLTDEFFSLPKSEFPLKPLSTYQYGKTGGDTSGIPSTSSPEQILSMPSISLPAETIESLSPILGNEAATKTEDENLITTVPVPQGMEATPDVMRETPAAPSSNAEGGQSSVAPIAPMMTSSGESPTVPVIPPQTMEQDGVVERIAPEAASTPEVIREVSAPSRVEGGDGISPMIQTSPMVIPPEEMMKTPLPTPSIEEERTSPIPEMPEISNAQNDITREFSPPSAMEEKGSISSPSAPVSNSGNDTAMTYAPPQIPNEMRESVAPIISTIIENETFSINEISKEIEKIVTSDDNGGTSVASETVPTKNYLPSSLPSTSDSRATSIPTERYNTTESSRIETSRGIPFNSTIESEAPPTREGMASVGQETGWTNLNAPTPIYTYVEGGEPGRPDVAPSEMTRMSLENEMGGSGVSKEIERVIREEISAGSTSDEPSSTRPADTMRSDLPSSTSAASETAAYGNVVTGSLSDEIRSIVPNMSKSGIVNPDLQKVFSDMLEAKTEEIYGSIHDISGEVSKNNSKKILDDFTGGL